MSKELSDIIAQLPQWLQATLMILGTLVVVASSYISTTHNEKLSALWAKIESIHVLGSILTFLERFSVVYRKGE